jgi:hypothetical protein
MDPHVVDLSVSSYGHACSTQLDPGPGKVGGKTKKLKNEKAETKINRTKARKTD